MEDRLCYALWVIAILGTWGVGLAIMGLMDLWLGLTGKMTISQMVWACPILGIPIIAWSLIGPVFLTLHFYFGLLEL